MPEPTEPLPLTALPTEPGEEWRDLPSDPGYAVSSFGRVALTLPGGSKLAGHIKAQRERDGGVEVGIRGRRLQVGRLVLEAFVGPPRPDEFAHRKDLDPANNHLDNLEWASRSTILLADHAAGRKKGYQLPRTKESSNAQAPV